MSEREREQIGPFVITSSENLDERGVTCAYCGKLLSRFNETEDTMTPTAEQLLENGSVPTPNFGWFCSQAHGNAYEDEFGTLFQRDLKGDVRYYADGDFR